MEDLKKQIIDLYINKGYGQQKIAKMVHCNYKKVKRILIENGYKIRNLKESGKIRSQKNMVNQPTPYTPEQERIALDCYVNQKRGIEYSRRQAKCSLNTFNKILKDNGIKKRTYAEAAVESNKNRALHKNVAYFDVQSPNMAWILGFLAADGCISEKRNEISLGLSSADIEILERIRKEIEIENKVRVYTDRKGFEYAELNWTCEQHKKVLSEYSIIPKKTFKLKPPYKLDKRYWIDYIRGYFDGDGSVNFIQSNGKKQYTALRWQVCSATPEILQFIVDYLEELGVKSVNIQKQNRKNSTLYSIQYSTTATIQIYNILYNTNSDLFLKRKKDHYTEILEKHITRIKSQETAHLQNEDEKIC